MHPDDRAWFVEAYTEASQEHVPFSAKLRMRRRGHAYRWMLFYAHPAFRDDGAFAGYVVAIGDTAKRSSEAKPRAVPPRSRRRS
jgi:hypothetical protein